MPTLRRLVEPLYLRLMQATHADLARQVEYLRAENRVLRSKVEGTVKISPVERRTLIELGKRVGPALRDLISIVHYDTFRRWVRELRGPRRARRPGRPRKPEAVRALVIRIGAETGWGYTRIHGELAKLGITDISLTTVREILREAGLRPRSPASSGCWDRFLRAHAETLWACDYLSKPVVTLRGIRTCYILFFLHIRTRTVIACPATERAGSAWSGRQAQVFMAEAERRGFAAPGIVIHDNDTKLGGGFDGALRARGWRPKRIRVRAPRLNAYAERWVGSVKRECLDHFVCFGRKHLDHLVAEYLEHYHAERPHQGIGSRTPIPQGTGPPGPGGAVVCRERLRGVLRHYERAAA
ncbi:MAG: transposase [Phycisphaerales bacterium]|nr:transposase [Phycisphaerales bacterium]